MRQPTTCHCSRRCSPASSRRPFRPPASAMLRGALEGESKPSALIAQLAPLHRGSRRAPQRIRPSVRPAAARAKPGGRRHRPVACGAHRSSLAAWIAAIGEFEALVFARDLRLRASADPFPVLRRGRSAVFDGSRARPSAAARSDGASATTWRSAASAARLLIVSGSNMSGKSTLLRAVGANAVLALAGAPVRAARLTLSPLAIGATIRVEDSLQQGHSRFYSEILQIRDIVQLAAAAQAGAVPARRDPPRHELARPADRGRGDRRVRWSMRARSGWSRRTTSR